MNLTLKRTQYRPDGIFSTLYDEAGKQLAVTVEHAYPDGKGGWKPKIPPGEYECVRGKHRLASMEHDFETFEITGVEGHDDLLFHTGNDGQKDSHGCVCTGTGTAEWPQGQVVVNSHVAFGHLMEAQVGLERFPLTVTA